MTTKDVLKTPEVTSYTHTYTHFRHTKKVKDKNG